MTLSRRDDIEALGYVVAYLLFGGKLPWMDLGSVDILYKQNSTLDKVRYSIAKTQNKLGPSGLCKGLRGGARLEKYLENSKRLAFEEEPDYDKLRGFFL